MSHLRGVNILLHGPVQHHEDKELFLGDLNRTVKILKTILLLYYTRDFCLVVGAGDLHQGSWVLFPPLMQSV